MDVPKAYPYQDWYAQENGILHASKITSNLH